MLSDISLGSKSDSCDSGSVGSSESLFSYSLFEHCLSGNDNLGRRAHFICFLPVSSSFGPKTHDVKKF